MGSRHSLAVELELTRQNEIEQVLHDEFYAGRAYTDEQLRKAAAPERLRLYRENSRRETLPKQQQFFVLGDLSGKVVCDYACGDGADSVLLAANGAELIHAFDISDEAVEITRRRARLCGIEHKVRASVGNAEQLSYPPDCFDAIHGSAVLHHLDMDRAARELQRVLKPGGHAVFREPFSQSRSLARLISFIFKISRLSPDAVSPQRQLNRGDLELLRRVFSTVNVTWFGILSRIDRFTGNRTLLRTVNRCDAFLLRHIAPLRRYARYIVIECIK